MAMEVGNYEDSAMTEDDVEDRFSNQRCFEMADVVTRASPALTSRARLCPRACNLGRVTLCRGCGTREAMNNVDDKRVKGNSADKFKGGTRSEEVSKAMKAA